MYLLVSGSPESVYLHHAYFFGDAIHLLCDQLFLGEMQHI